MGCGLVAKYSLLGGNRRGVACSAAVCIVQEEEGYIVLQQVVQSEKHKISFHQGERPFLLLPLDHVVTFQKWLVLPL